MMNKRRVILGFAAVIVILGIVASISLFSPQYQGRSLSFWLEELNRASKPQNIDKSLEAIVAIDTNALPFLITNLRQKDQIWWLKTCAFINRNPVCKFPFKTAESLYGPTLLALQALGSKASPLLPDIEQLLANDRSVSVAFQAFMAIGTNATPAVLRACAHSNQLVRATAPMVLYKISKREELFLTWRSNAAAGRQIAHTGWSFGDDEIKAIAATLRHQNSDVRRASADALGFHAGIAKLAIPDLTAALKDPDELVRKAAADALLKIDPSYAASIGLK